jgi:hypothetical protein
VRAKLLPVALVIALCVPVLDPDVQIFWRDTQRFFFPFKLLIAERLRRGELPLWDPWTESGVSVLGQLTPGLWHPTTLLYLVFPFSLAFKLNHLLALPLAAVGAWLLARRLGASAWAAAVSASAFAGSGFLCSMTASNLPFALGNATLPLAVDAALGFVERPQPPRLLWASLVLGSCGLCGEPQSMLLAGLIAGAWTLGRGPRRARRLGFLALCGVCGAIVAAPAALPAAARLRLTDPHRLQRAEGFFALDARRLPALALPWAFDDTPELAGPRQSDTAYSEYFSGEPHVAFADSIALGVPVLILAAFAPAGLLLGALFFVLAALGPALPVEWLAAHVVPGFALFRYPEKLIGPASLLLALAGAVGLSRASSRRLFAVSVATSAAFAGAGLLSLLLRGTLAAALVAHGRTHASAPGPLFVDLLVRSLFCQSALAGLLAAASRLGDRRALAGAMVCSIGAWLAGSRQLVTAPRELLESRVPLVDLLEQRGGPSAGRWRIDSDTEQSLMLPGLDARLRRAAWSAQVLAPRTNAVQRIESAVGYGSLPDDVCENSRRRFPDLFHAVMGVRFAVSMPWEPARSGGFSGPYGMRIAEMTPGPRAFLVGHVLADGARVRDFLREAIADAPLDELGLPGSAELLRQSPERMRISVAAPGPRLLVVSEHFDPGWRASIDGAAATVIRADFCALAVRIPAGVHRVDMRFVPIGMVPGAILGGALLVLLVALSALWHARRH